MRLKQFQLAAKTRWETGNLLLTSTILLFDVGLSLVEQHYGFMLFGDSSRQEVRLSQSVVTYSPRYRATRGFISVGSIRYKNHIRFVTVIRPRNFILRYGCGRHLCSNARALHGNTIAIRSRHEVVAYMHVYTTVRLFWLPIESTPSRASLWASLWCSSRTGSKDLLLSEPHFRALAIEAQVLAFSQMDECNF